MRAQIIRNLGLTESWFLIREQDLQFRPAINFDGESYIEVTGLEIRRRMRHNPTLTWGEHLKDMGDGGFAEVPDHIVEFVAVKARQRLRMLESFLTMQQLVKEGKSLDQAFDTASKPIFENVPAEDFKTWRAQEILYHEQLEFIISGRGLH